MSPSPNLSATLLPKHSKPVKNPTAPHNPDPEKQQWYALGFGQQFGNRV